MRVKEVKVSDTERFVICHNPDAAERDAHVREQSARSARGLVDQAGPGCNSTRVASLLCL
jgi:hypothetical protein